MHTEMKAPWREWLTLQLGGKANRLLSIHRLSDSDSLASTRIRLLALALRDRDIEVRENATDALERLTRYLHHGMVRLGGQATTIPQVLDLVETWMREGGAIQSLQACLTDDNWHLRRGAAVALGQIRAREAVEPLIKALRGDPDGHVCEQAAAALGRIGDRRAVDVLIQALLSTTHHSESTPDGYWHADRVVRLKCVQALGDLGDPRAFPALTTAMNESGEDKEMRDAAHSALNQVGGEEAYNTLRRAPPIA